MRALATALLLLATPVLAGPPDGAPEPAAAELESLLLPGVARAAARGMTVRVGETKRVLWRRAYKEATERYAGQARLGPAGELLDYVAGLPFPNLKPDDRQLADKIVWNHAFGPWIADDATAYTFEWEMGALREGRGMSVESSERRDSEQSMWIRMVGRTEVPPIPAFPDNDQQLMSMQIFGPTLPVFLTMQRSGPLLTYRYMKLTEDDLWFYMAWDRKARRIPATVRYEAFGDVVIDLNSSWGLDAPHGSYTWRYVGEREMLGVLHGREYPAQWCPGAGDFAPCETWEKRNVFVVEGIANKPYDSYGKRVIAIDREAWVVLATDLYDKDGAFWKTWMNFWSYRPYAGAADGEEQAYLLAGSGVDFQDEKALRWRLPGTRPLAEAVRINTGLTPDRFSPGALGNAFGPVE